ncbi:head-tail connector protein [Alkalilacustris brevis]|uniref:head-tail connector protein n=1 Tax=Alkalilacustris brevis TaxID=2026338 RepID=UPI000E0DD74A|nr:hypothetical protein [Alkalilacustris brevis]
MMLSEESPVAAGVLPLAAFKEHLRLGAGFADDGGQDALLEQYLRAALAAIEARISKVLLAREFRLRLSHWRGGQAQSLPLAPILAVTQVVMVSSDGAESVVDPARYRLEPDMHRPRLCASGWLLPAVPSGGAVEIVFEAGFGPAWDDLPPDLAQAVMLLAAQYHETRQATGAAGSAVPFGVMSLIERWRTVRSLGGGGAA